MHLSFLTAFDATLARYAPEGTCVWGDTMRPITLFAAVLLVCGCSTLGNNEHFMVVNKSDLVAFYTLDRFTRFTKDCYSDEQIKKLLAAAKVNSTDALAEIAPTIPISEQFESTVLYRCQDRKFRWPADLKHIYWNDLPFVTSDAYDTRISRYKKIRAGDPINIVVNRVWIEESLRSWKGTGRDIAVVLSVDDGSPDGGKDVLVAYEKGVRSKTSLPISDLLAYSNDYKGEPLRITLTVYSFGGESEKLLEGLMNGVMTAVSTLAPGSAAVVPVAESVGQLLIKQGAQNVLLRFTFQLYPWAETSTVGSNIGVPRIARGSYLIVNEKKPDAALKDRKRINLDWDLHPYHVNATETGSATAGGAGRDESACPKSGEKPAKFPECAHVDNAAGKDPLPLNYMLVTVDSTSLTAARDIVDRADRLAREAAGIKAGTRIGLQNSADVENAAHAVLASLKVYRAEESFRQTRDKPPTALRVFWDARRALGDAPATAGDRDRIDRRLRDLLPATILETSPCNAPASAECERWWSAHGSGYAYNADTARYKPTASNTTSNEPSASAE